MDRSMINQRMSRSPLWTRDVPLQHEVTLATLREANAFERDGWRREFASRARSVSWPERQLSTESLIYWRKEKDVS